MSKKKKPEEFKFVMEVTKENKDELFINKCIHNFGIFNILSFILRDKERKIKSA